MVQLSTGCCQRLQAATPDDAEVFEQEYTVQFLSVKLVGNNAKSANPNAAPQPERHRIIMSDGVHYMQAMLATQLNHLVHEQKVDKNVIVVLEKLTCNYVQEKPLVIVLSLRVIQPGGPEAVKIGDPQPIHTAIQQTVQHTEAASPAVRTAAPAAAAENSKPSRPQPPPPPQAARGNIYPIEGLSPYQNTWTIKARVTQKSEIKKWSNPRGEGKLFNVTLMDDTGEIRGTGFNVVVDELYPKLQEGKVYYISKARVNLAKKKFSNVNNDYELHFERNTEVEECHDTSNLPSVKYNFVPLSSLGDLPPDSICDVIAIVKEVSPVTEITSQKLSRTLQKRELTLVDESKASVTLTLWGKQAESYDADDAPVVAFKGVKVGEFRGGRTLSMFSSSTMQVNPEIDASFKLRGWYDSGGANESFTAQSTTSAGSSSSGPFNRNEMRTFDEVKTQGYGLPEKPVFFSARGTIMHIRENISYPACPTDGCNKKVNEMGDSWRCEKCNLSFGSPSHRYETLFDFKQGHKLIQGFCTSYIISMAAADYSGQAWLQGFNDVGEVVFGMPANDLIALRDNDRMQYDTVLRQAICKTYNFACRAKQDNFKDNMRVRPPSIMITPARSNFIRSTSGTTSYTPTIVSNATQPRMNIVSRVAVEGRVRKGQDNASIKMFLKLSVPLDNVAPGSTIPLFPEENIKVITSRVHPLNSNSVPYNFSSSSSPLLHAAARALNLPARSTECFPGPTSASKTPSRSKTDSHDIPPVEPHYTGSIVVSGYNVAFVLPKVLPNPEEQSETDHPKTPLHRRRMSLGDRPQVHFMAAIDMLVPLASRPPRAPYLLVIPTPRCLHNHIKLRIFPPVAPSASFASLSSVEEDGNMWDLTSDPHVTRTTTARPKRTGSYTHFADDESSESSGQGTLEGCIIQGTFPSAEKIRIRWAKPIKRLNVPGMDRSGRRRVGVEEVKGEMVCTIHGKGTSASNSDVEGVIMSVEYKGHCKGVWFPGVATLLGLDVGLQAKNSDISWPANYNGHWEVSGDVGYTGFDHGTPSHTSNFRSPSMESNGSANIEQEFLSNIDSTKPSSASLLRAPLPSNVAEYSFEGSGATLPSSSTSPLGTLSSIASLPTGSTAPPAKDCSPGSPITLHLNVSELKPPPHNVFSFKISGTILVANRSPSLRLIDNTTSSGDPDPVVLPRFTVLAADTESISTIVRNAADNISVEVFHPTGDIHNDPQTRKTVLQKDSSTKCGEEGGRIALKSFDSFGNTFVRPATTRSRTPSNSMLTRHPSPHIPRANSSSRGNHEGPNMIPSVHARITPIARDPSSSLPTGYAVRLCLGTPWPSESEWLEFGMAPGAKAHTDITKTHAKVTLICASIDGVPIKGEASKLQANTKASTGGAPFEAMMAYEWAYWCRIHVGPTPGRNLILDYVVREAEPVSGNGKKSSTGVRVFNALLPTFLVSTARLEVEIDPLQDLQITDLTSNFDYHSPTPMGNRLFMYSVEAVSSPVLSFGFKKQNKSHLQPRANLWTNLWWTVFCALTLYVHLRFLIFDRLWFHAPPGFTTESQLPSTTTVTTTIYQTTTTTDFLTTTISSPVIAAKSTSTSTPITTFAPPEEMPKLMTTSIHSDKQSDHIVSAPNTISEQTYQSVLQRFGLFSLEDMFDITSWSFEHKTAAKGVLEKVAATLETSTTKLAPTRMRFLSSVSHLLWLKPYFHRFSAHQSRKMATTTHPDWISVSSQSGHFRQFNKPILKSEQDDRDYRIITLDNGLQATLVHDAKADKAAASLDVAVGHLYDPDDMPGLAHFCEHLLFMGTESFPKENEYSEFLAKNNGSSNAYTSTSNTNYYFNVATSALPGALERFSAFFHCPLFAPSCTSRELNAVDSEHKKNHQADMWRIFQLNKHLSKPGHVWSKFGSGNRSSLSQAARDLKVQGKLSTSGSKEPTPASSLLPSPIPSRKGSPAPSVSSTTSEGDADGGVIGRETRRRLVEWWSQEYCASRMRLCIVGNDSLDTLADYAVKLFSPIPNRGKDPLPMIIDHPFGAKEKGTCVSVQTVMAFHAVEISFPLEYQPPNWRYKPANFLSHFIGHEGPGSLYSYLKNKHWVTSLSCGPQSLARGFAMFKVTIHLTPEGFAQYQSVVHATFKYLSLLRASVFDQYHHQELVKLSATRFRFAEKRRPDDYATSITEHMAWPLPRDMILAGPRLTFDYINDSDKKMHEAKISQYLDSFKLGNSRVVLMAPKADHEKLHPQIQWENEPWYGTGYYVQRFDQNFIEKAESPNDIPEFFLPGPNEFIPDNLNVEKKDVAEPCKRPYLIRQTPLSTLWHKKDDQFWVPKAHIVIDLRSPVANASPRSSVMTRLYSDLVNDSLSEYSYNADLAGLTYSFSSHTGGLYITMHGYNDKMSILAEHVLDRMKHLVIDPQRLSVLKEQARREWENFFLGQSYTLSDYYGRYLMTERQWTVDEKLKELPAITANEIQDHVKKLLAQVNIRMLIMGNIFKDEAIKIAEEAEKELGTSPLSPTELNDRGLLLPKGSNHIWSSTVPNANQPNSALTYFTYYGPVRDDKLRVTGALLTQILSEPAFNVLRTREQLGYIVSCSSWSLAGSTDRGLRIVVQSEKKPNYLEERVEAFLDEMKDKLQEMTEDELEHHKSALEKKWLEAHKNLGEEVGRYTVYINNGQWDFMRNERSAAVLKTLKKQDVVDLFLSNVHPSSVTRAKLSVHMKSLKPVGQSVSTAASQAFEDLVRSSLPEIDARGWRNAVDGEEPSLMDFGQYWMKVLNSDAGKLVLMQLPALLEKYPSPGQEADARKPGVTYIEDIKAFRAGLKPTTDPGPMVNWNDLPTARF
ncbi:hypothetical protein CVT24_003365 [Panaeolus cyanescens]|uniref:Replication protein A subunit n=1 Tax=Panaeolus cyanescens TaxID=181874 RepID=A0A409Y784_9AGAR|nr:hypothetical protein CVT24_003365 [Panaeolus cyanescens]